MINELLMKEVIDHMEHMVRVMDQDDRVVYMNQSMIDQFGNRIGTRCYEVLQEEKRCEDCICEECHRSGKAEAKDIKLEDRHFRVIASPVVMKNREKYSIELFQDISNEKAIEKELSSQYRKMKQDIDFAKQIQYRALPADGIYWDCIAFDSLYQPSEALGGDLYDIYQIDENHVLFYIADVSGHGIQSSLLTIFLRQVIRGLKAEAKDPMKILYELIRNYQDLNLTQEQYFSILFCVYHRDSHKLVFVNAGHNALPLILHENGTVEEIQIGGMPVCVLLTEAIHQTVTVSMKQGDKVVLFTDGITETWNEKREEHFSSERLIRWMEEHHGQQEKTNATGNQNKKLLEDLVHDLNQFSGGGITDDIAILIAEFL